MIRYVRTTDAGRYTVYGDDVFNSIGEITRGKNKTTYTITIKGVYWLYGLPNKTGGTPSHVCKNLKEAAEMFDMVYSNPDLQDYFTSKMEAIKAEFEKKATQFKADASPLRHYDLRKMREKEMPDPKKEKILAKYPNSGKRWTPEEEELMKKKWENYTNKFGQTEVNAIFNLYKHLKRAPGGILERLAKLKLIDGEDKDKMQRIKEHATSMIEVYVKDNKKSSALI